MVYPDSVQVQVFEREHQTTGRDGNFTGNMTMELNEYADVTSWDCLMDQIVAEMVESGAFGPGRGYVSFAQDADGTSGQDNFASTVVYGTVTVSDGPVHQRCRIVVKKKHQSPIIRALYKNDQQFHNEILFYERIAPFLLAVVPTAERRSVAPLFCRYLYGRNDCDASALRDMIILENTTTTHGYRMSDERLHLDFDHLVMALKTLAK